MIGIALIIWDNLEGGKLEFKYPENISITNEVINRLYVAHSFQEEERHQKDIIEISFHDVLYVSFKSKSSEDPRGFDIFTIILSGPDVVKKSTVTSKFISFARKVFSLRNTDRREYIQENIRDLINEREKIKVLLIGKPGTGKTSIKQVVFEGKNPRLLLEESIEPTFGLNSSAYSWLNLDIGLFDSSGQDFQRLETDIGLRERAFTQTDLVIYVIDFNRWIKNSDEILKEIKMVKNLILDGDYNVILELFFHKTDLIDTRIKQDYYLKIPEIIKMEIDSTIHFTSIHPDNTLSLFDAIYDAISKISPELRSLKKILDEKLESYEKTTVFIFDDENRILAQSFTKDFNYTLINHIQRIAMEMEESFSMMKDDDTVGN